MTHIPRKRFGQNFLQDQNIIHKIVRNIGPKKTDHLVEIGPGLGAITAEILLSAGKLDAIEIDRDLIDTLRQQFAGNTNFTLHNADALNFDFKQLCNNDKLRIIGNLPYNISTPLLFHLFDQLDVIADMHFMLQKEVVDRLCAQTNDSNYGRLSVMSQYYCQIESLFLVPPTCFHPPPKVNSAIVRLTPKTISHTANDIDVLAKVVKQAFNYRRKTLRNSLKPLLNADQLATLGIDANKRPQELSIDDYVTIANGLSAFR